MLRIGLLFCALALCALLNAIWTAGGPREVHGFGFPESFVADEAQTEALRLALTQRGSDLEARERRR